MSSFVHLHVHSHYSLLDGMSNIKDLIDKAAKCGMPAIALTDHGNMFGIKEFIDYASKKNGGTQKEIKELKKQLNDTENESQKAEIQTKISELEKKLVKPILGCEVYVARRAYKYNNTNPERTKEDIGGWHLILLAKNKKGYQNLCKMISVSWIDGVYSKPRIDKELLEKYHEGIIACSACLGGEIPQKLMGGKYQVDEEVQPDSNSFEEASNLISDVQLTEAEKAIEWYKNLFGDDFYIELQRHETSKPGAERRTYEKQKLVNQHLIALAKKTNTKVIASNDVHFVEEEHAEAHDRLICLSTGKDLDDPKRMRYTKQEWLKTTEEMQAIFADIPESIENTFEIANKVEYYSIDSEVMMPMFPIPEEFGTEESYRKKFSEEDLKKEFGNRYEKLGGYDKVVRIKLEADYLTKLTYEGVIKRYGENLTDEVKERIDFELETMKKMGFPGYFLIVEDFIRQALKMGVSVGPGRGSAAGSVVAYCLRITDIDPLKYDLLFERFLNPDRISMPDIDIDFDDDGRSEVLKYVTDKYGKEKVAHIITYGTMATKLSIKDVARVQKLPLSDAERLTKLIPSSFPEDKDGKSPKVNIKNCIKLVPELQQELTRGDQNLIETLKYAEMLEGTVRQTGVHACGVIIGADDLTNFVPLSTAKEKGSNEDVLVTQYEGSVVENVGLIKMDFLGLKTLSIIKEALKNIKLSKGIDINIDTIPIDDSKTYELFSQGLTTGIFQFESPGMQKNLKELQPTKFEDLIAMNALYRPGPMQYIPQFINRKHGKEHIQYDLPEMEERLKDTYGVTVYQEQVMLLSRDLAGFTRGQSDELRKAMGKKLKDKMETLKIKFIEGATKKGFGPIEKLEKIWSDWSEFAKYAFNKSHATCYSWIAYQTAYLKANYPAEFMAANLTRNKDSITEVTKFMDECRMLGIKVLGPDVNESFLNFTVNDAGEIRFGLGGIKGVGEGAVDAIIEERKKNGKYKDVFDFVERVNLSTCNRKAMESLAYSGAFDNCGILREQFEAIHKGEIVLDTILRYGNKYQNDKAQSSISLFGDFNSVDITKPEIPKVPAWSLIERLNKEKELIGIYLSSHPLDEYFVELKSYCNAEVSILKDGLAPLKNRTLKFGGMITSSRTGTTKKGNPYGGFTLEDFSGSYEFMLWGNDFGNFGNYMLKDSYVLVKGTVQERGIWKKNDKTTGDENKPVEYEFKIQKISFMSEMDEKEIKSITLSIPVENIDDGLVSEISTLVKKNNEGKLQLHVQVIDQYRRKLHLLARETRIKLDSDMKKFLREKKQQDIFDFTLNEN